MGHYHLKFFVIGLIYPLICSACTHQSIQSNENGTSTRIIDQYRDLSRNCEPNQAFFDGYEEKVPADHCLDAALYDQAYSYHERYVLGLNTARKRVQHYLERALQTRKENHHVSRISEDPDHRRSASRIVEQMDARIRALEAKMDKIDVYLLTLSAVSPARQAPAARILVDVSNLVGAGLPGE